MSSAETVIVLPPNEGFSPDAVGAIGLLVHRLARAGAGGLVLGMPTQGEPFPDVPFQPVQPGWGFTRAARYIRGLAAAIRAVRPRLIEVHNRPEVALALLDLGRPVSLILNNDPQQMREAGSARHRVRLLRRLTLVMTSSDWLRSRLLEGVTAPPRLPVVLPNCIDVPPRATGTRENLILFAGRVVRDKGADTFVEACARALPKLPGWRAEIIGADRFRRDSPETEFIRTLRPRAEAAGIDMRGHLPNSAVLLAMQRAAIVVVPSRWAEPFGLVALEAMACGAALVCSPHGGLPEVAGETALYADPDQPGDVAAAILELATDVGRRATLAAAARLRSEGFGAPAAAARLLQLRAEILQS
ncbi:MAG: glycosyltransferase family 4 protein [Acetobacteraceae bacterium]|nr:glycosyltransferase family 4 protein [Acetobacteraceae bacterium]